MRQAHAVCVGLLAVMASACSDVPRRVQAGPSPVARAAVDQERAALAISRLEHQVLSWPEERERFRDAASAAWTFVDRHTQPATGLVTVVNDFPYTTMWDVASMLAAIYSARQLGFIDDGAYDARMQQVLGTLARMDLYDNRMFNKAYDTRTGEMVKATSDRPDAWQGWSATDLGRLLIWLKIVSVDPRYTAAVTAIVKRSHLADGVRSGYLWGEDLSPQGEVRQYPEGSIGYEQYAARGFALWGVRAEKSLSLTENALPITVMGQRLVTDFRRWDRLTSEPFVLWGLELGWEPQVAALTRRILLAQEARYRQTGHVTLVAEDAIPVPPHYFYYYCLYANGKDFAIEVQTPKAVADGPRWVSAKAAFAFHALMPSRYTAAAVEALGDAHDPGGWAAGVYETTQRSTGSVNINTAAVILTAALVDQRGEPVLAEASAAMNP